MMTSMVLSLPLQYYDDNHDDEDEDYYCYCDYYYDDDDYYYYHYCYYCAQIGPVGHFRLPQLGFKTLRLRI